MITGATAAIRRTLLTDALPMPRGFFHDEWLGFVASLTGRVVLLEEATTAPGHIFNLGHGMNPDMLPEHAAVVVDAVHSYSTAQRARTSLA